MVAVNYLAILVCGIVGFGLGWLWFGPLFGKQWMALSGKTMPAMMTPEIKAQMNKSYAIAFLGSLVMAYVLANALVFASTYLHTSGVSAGIAAGFWNWLGFIAPVTIGMVLWEGKPWKLWVLNAGHYLVTLCVMGVILALWK